MQLRAVRLQGNNAMQRVLIVIDFGFQKVKADIAPAVI